ncbi:hypothetical protein C5167_048734 [Papaver somniferum]|uniref:Uncharacterized protein n=1 Tax=Papaver somniferum TaxID=3469 RepID=A0A4Y7KLP4_PAPSO|nr:hypothetical protein C5167_048734 [Papaver somniferum]
MDMEDFDESLYSREKVLGKYMEFLHECSTYASILQLPQEWYYSFCPQQGESSNNSPLSSVPHRMNQPSADQLCNTTLLQRQQQLHRVSQQTQQQVPENVPQNVASQLQQLAAPSLSQQAASSSSRTATSSQQGSSTQLAPELAENSAIKRAQM